MRLAVITHVVHTKKDEHIFGYGPYVREMNMWFAQTTAVVIVAPLSNETPDTIDLAYKTQKLSLQQIPEISLKGITNLIKTSIALPGILAKISRAMHRADHIHLRCPGNIGLLGCIVQIAFPKKKKTAKYAGNWDPDAKQPWSYKLQKAILRNTFLTKNMQVLVYGDWPNQTRNIKPFFTATYPEAETKVTVVKNWSQPYKAVFVGTMGANKRPLETVIAVHKSQQLGVDIQLDVYGKGDETASIEDYIEEYGLSDSIKLYGNQPAAVVKEAYKNAHFAVLLSKSEGWPKAVAEAMFWGAIPIATNVSCVSWMLGEGKRGLVVDTEGIDQLPERWSRVLEDTEALMVMSENAQQWSRQYTTTSFETVIKALL